MLACTVWASRQSVSSGEGHLDRSDPGAARLSAILMTRDECLQHAEECEELAGMAKLEINRLALLESAAMWRDAADYKFAPPINSAH